MIYTSDPNRDTPIEELPRCELCGAVMDDDYLAYCNHCDTIIAESIDECIGNLCQDLDISERKAREIIKEYA